MIIDALLNFTGGTVSPGNSDGMTDSPTTGTQASSNVLDLGIKGTTATVGQPNAARGGGARDIGIGDDPAMKVLITVTVAFTVGTNMAISLQGAPDSGTGTEGTYATFYTTPTWLEANMVVGARLADIDMPRPPLGMANVAIPRFLRLSYVTSGTHTTGTIWGTLVLDRWDQPQSAVGVAGGYVAGIDIAN